MKSHSICRPASISKYAVLGCTFLLAARSASAQTATTKPPISNDSAAKIEGVRVTAERDKKPTLTKLTLPSTQVVTANKVAETVNFVDTEDAVKYLPSLFLRKRNNGDTQAVMATRVWGVSSSARSLVFADGVPLTALIANNNNIGAPRWGLVAPEEIDRIDVMYGPYSAAYSGNSLGAVVEITTKLPDKLVGSVSYTGAMQNFNLYATKKNYGTSQGAATIGNRFGNFHSGQAAIIRTVAVSRSATLHRQRFRLERRGALPKRTSLV